MVVVNFVVVTIGLQLTYAGLGTRLLQCRLHCTRSWTCVASLSIH